MDDEIYAVDSVSAHTATTHKATTWGGWAPESGTLDITGNTIIFSGSQEPERSKNMRGLYEVLVVNPKTEEIIGPIFVVAKDEQGALLKADLPQEIRSNSDHYDFCIDFKGQVRAKKDVQKVRVVKEEEE